MWVPFFLLPAIAAFGLIWVAREALRERDVRWGALLAGLGAVAGVMALLAFRAWLAHPHAFVEGTYPGFGPGLSCRDYGEGEPVCVKAPDGDPTAPHVLAR